VPIILSFKIEFNIADNSSQGHKSDCFGSPVCRKIYRIPVVLVLVIIRPVHENTSCINSSLAISKKDL